MLLSPTPSGLTEHKSRGPQRTVLAEQVRLLYENATLASCVTVVVASVLSYLQWKVVRHSIVIGWLVYMMAIALGRFVLGHLYRNFADHGYSTRIWLHAFLIGTGMSAAGWGAAGLLLYPETDLAHQVFLAFALGGMVAGAASVLAARIETFALFILLSGLPGIARMFVQVDDVHIAMGSLALLYTLAILFTARGVYSTIVSGLALQFENQHLLASLQASKHRAEALAIGLLGAQDEEHRRVSRELHDGLNQTIAILLIDAELLEQQLTAGVDQNLDPLRSLKNHAKELSVDLQRIIHQLHPLSLEKLGLLAALGSFCTEFSNREQISVRFRHRRVPVQMSPDIALCVYRVVQEGLRNVAKHSGSRTAAIILIGSERYIRVSVRDSGVGFQPEMRYGTGLGLLSMEERARVVGGSFAVNSRSGRGTKIEVRIPLGFREPLRGTAES